MIEVEDLAATAEMEVRRVDHRSSREAYPRGAFVSRPVYVGVQHGSLEFVFLLSLEPGE
jgi:hypothetical protein